MASGIFCRKDIVRELELEHAASSWLGAVCVQLEKAGRVHQSGLLDSQMMASHSPKSMLTMPNMAKDIGHVWVCRDAD